MSERLSEPEVQPGGAVLAGRSASSPAEILRRYGPVAAGYALPFLLVFYLALRGGGYDSIVRGEVGIAIWWVVLLGAAVGALPATRLSRSAWIMLGLLAAFGAWTALSISWSESSERSAAELARVAAYLGVFILAVAAQGRDGLRRAVYSIGAAIAVVGIFALLSRLHPSWFPRNEGISALGDTARTRLNYPLNYWNGLAALVAIGTPLLLVIATEARHTLTRVLAAAAVPALCVTAFYTLSRGGALELAVALAALVALHPRRLALMPTIAIAGGGGALAVAAASQRHAVADGLTNQLAASQADEMLAVVLVICAGVGLLQAAVALAARYGLGPRIQISRRDAGIATAIAAIAAVSIAFAAGLPGEISDRWDEFKDPGAGAANASAERFESASGNGRYQYWQSALDANATDELRGIGAGTFEFWWARKGTIPGFIRDAHSLYLETLAELGVVGFLLVGGLIAFVLATAVIRALRSAAAERAVLAAAAAGCFAFATAAAIDWAWELTVLPVVFLMLSAGIVARRGVDAPTGRSLIVSRIGLAIVALAALTAIAIPLAGADSLQASQDQVKNAQLQAALDKAQAAKDIQPYAATPSLQKAMILEISGDLEGAAAAATQATKDEPTNWRTWLLLSRVEARLGKIRRSVDAYREARSLNPRSPLFQ